MCKTAQWGIRLSVIDDEVDEDSTEEEDDNERSKLTMKPQTTTRTRRQAL